jgi:hypothetical protein
MNGKGAVRIGQIWRLGRSFLDHISLGISTHLLQNISLKEEFLYEYNTLVYNLAL